MTQHGHHLTILEKYRKRGQETDFWRFLDWYLAFGYVFATPRFFAMLQPVKRGTADFHSAPCPRTEADAWYFHAAAGEVAGLREAMPYQLPWVCFARNKRNQGPLKYYPFTRIDHLLKHLA